MDPHVLAGPQASEVLDESTECRLIVESEAAALAAQWAGEEGRSALAAALVAMTGAARRTRGYSRRERAYGEAELRFDRTLTDAARNPALARMAESIQRGFDMVRPEGPARRARLERGAAERERILQAVVRREPAEAREAMRENLLSEAEELREGVSSGSGA